MKSDNTKPLQAIINKNSSVFIKPVKDSTTFEQSAYAINWFNTRQLWLYNLYNLLASKSVLKVKGVPFFKGLTQEVLLGEKELQRDVLLIVVYPSFHAFKNMLENLYFQLVSVLRMAAVKSFGFGFFSPEASLNIPEKDDNSVYAFHHFTLSNADEDGTVDEGKTVDETLRQLKEVISHSSNNVSLIFEGGIAAHLYSGNQEPKVKIPCLMDGAIVLKADNVDTLKELISVDDYQALIKQTKHSFIAVMKRVI